MKYWEILNKHKDPFFMKASRKLNIDKSLVLLLLNVNLRQYLF